MATNTSIVDRVVERLKLAPVGDLITEEDLFDIVKQAIPKVFFEERVVNEGYGRTTRHPPLIFDAMKQGMEAHVRKAVANWLVENADIMKAHWQKVLDESLLNYVQRLQSEAADTNIRAALKPIFDTLNDERSKAGLPYIHF